MPPQKSFLLQVSGRKDMLNIKSTTVCLSETVVFVS